MKRFIAEAIIYILHIFLCLFFKSYRIKQPRILILRNNGLGDLLCTTPLFELIKKKYPTSKVYVAIGSWHKDLLDNNPYIDKVIRVNAPWHNQFTGDKKLFKILKFIFTSRKSYDVKKEKFDIGIDIVGSIWGTLFMMRCGIPFRIGVKGYAGGHNGCQKFIYYNINKHVCQAALDMGRLLNIDDKIEARPQVYLSKYEINLAEQLWSSNNTSRRVVLAPGGSFNEKCWNKSNYQNLLQLILIKTDYQLIIIGGDSDNDIINFDKIDLQYTSRYQNMIGKFSLRETASIIATCNNVICNSSFSMHLAASFKKPTLTLLGEWYESAKKHENEWGYPETIVSGKETNLGILETTTVNKAFGLFKELCKFNP